MPSKLFGSDVHAQPVSEDDTLVSKKEFLARVDEARREIAQGNGLKVEGKEALASLGAQARL